MLKSRTPRWEERHASVLLGVLRECSGIGTARAARGNGMLIAFRLGLASVERGCLKRLLGVAFRSASDASVEPGT